MQVTFTPPTKGKTNKQSLASDTSIENPCNAQGETHPKNIDGV